ncbi:hypothetical protein LTR17_011655 [Elasticomyces elasticus]|nr:hypothetical protein LTR17_011655 [Elasticomyces elasticus]
MIAAESFKWTGLLKYTWPQYIQSRDFGFGFAQGTVIYWFFEKLEERFRDEEKAKADAVTRATYRSSMREKMQAVMTGRPIVYLPRVLLFRDKPALVYATNAEVGMGMGRFDALLTMGDGIEVEGMDWLTGHERHRHERETVEHE